MFKISEEIKNKGRLPVLIFFTITSVLLMILYAFSGIFSIWTRVVFILFLVSLILLFFIYFNFFKQKMKKQSTMTGLFKVAQFSIILILLVIFYLMSNLIPWQMDLTQSRLYTLSGQTKELIQRVTNKFQVYIFREKDWKNSPAASVIANYQENLLKVYAKRNPHIQIYIIDPLFDKEKANKFKIENNGTVVMIYNGNRRKISVDQIYDMNRNTGDLIYKGESAYTTALKSLLFSKPKVVYVLSGHGEIQPGVKHEFGHSEIFHKLQEDDIRVQMLNLLKMREIPHDTGALIIANPVKTLLPEELDQIKNYIDGGGDVLVMLEYHVTPMINDVLKQMGLYYYPNIIIEDELYSEQEERSSIVPIILPFKDITIPLLKESLQVVMPTAGGFFTMDRKNLDPKYNYVIIPLLKTSKYSYGEISEKEISSGKTKYNKKDLRGPLYPAYAVKRILLDIETNKKSIITNITESRMVAIGDVDFVNNMNEMRYGNSDFFLNSVNFLLGRDRFVTTRPKKTTYNPVILSSQAKRGFLILTLLLVFGYLGTGIFISLKRRRKIKS